MGRRICFVVASEMTVKAFLLEQMQALSGPYDVSLAVDTADPALIADTHPAIRVFPIVIRRNISPWRDGLALWRPVVLFLREGFDIVHSVTPNAGLLAMLAGLLAAAPALIPNLTGPGPATAPRILPSPA